MVKYILTFTKVVKSNYQVLHTLFYPIFHGLKMYDTLTRFSLYIHKYTTRASILIYIKDGSGKLNAMVYNERVQLHHPTHSVPVLGGVIGLYVEKGLACHSMGRQDHWMPLFSQLRASSVSA